MPGSEAPGLATDFGVLGLCCIESVSHLLIEVLRTNEREKLKLTFNSCSRAYCQFKWDAACPTFGRL